MFKQFTDWLSEGTLLPVRLETDAEHLARFNERARQLREELKTRYLLHPSNQVKRIDGKSYRAEPAPQNVRVMRKKVAA